MIDQNPYIEKNEDSIDIKKIVFKIVTNWYLFVFFVFISLSVAYFVNRYTVSTYSISAAVLVKDQDYSGIQGSVEGVLSDLGFNKRGGKKTIENEMGILKSYDLIYKTIQELDFEVAYFSIGRININERYKTSPFKVVLDTSSKYIYSKNFYVTLLENGKINISLEDENNTTSTIEFGQEFKYEEFSFKIEKVQKEYGKIDDFSIKYFFVVNDPLSLAKQYRSLLNVSQFEKKSSILLMELNTITPQKGVDFLNKHAEVYLQSNLDEKNRIAINTQRFIDEQLRNIVDSLKRDELNLLNFRMNNNVINISEEGSAIFKNLEKLQNDKSLLDIKLKYYDYLRDYIESKNNTNFQDVVAPSTIGIDDNLLTTLIGKLSEYYSERNVLSYSLKKKTPSSDLIEIKIKNAKESLIENVKNLIQTTNISVKETNNRIKIVESELKKLPLTEQQLINMKRKFELSDNLYTYLREKRAEVGIIQASNVPDNKILDIARLNNATNIAPKKSVNYLIALILGIALPLFIIILRDFFNNKITDVKEIEEQTRIPILGNIGHNNKGTEQIVKEKPKSAISESFRALRTNLQYVLPEKDSFIISITSAISGEGKTFCAINLATIIAISNKKTILLGLDLRKPKLHSEMNLSNDIGISTYLIGKNTLDEIIIESGVENLHIITSGPVPPNPAELIESKKMYQLLDILKEKYDYIIIDTPPIALVTDALLISKISDANIFVVRQNYSNKSVVKLINDVHSNKKTPNLSIIINDVNVSSYYGYNTYGYGYGTGYGQGYYDEDYKIEQESWLQKLLKKS